MINKGTKDPKWPQVIRHLEKDRPSLELFVKGAKRPAFGYVYRDVANNNWLALASLHSSSETYAAGQLEVTRRLPQVQDARLVYVVLDAAAREAAAQRHGGAAAEYRSAELGLTDQLWHADQFAVVDIVCCYYVGWLSGELLDALAEKADLLTNRELTDLAHRLSRVCDGRPRIRYGYLRELVDDYLQHAYTDDGEGGGRFTPAGVEALSAYVRQSREKWLESENLNELTAPLFAAAVADRREMRAKMLELVDLFIEARERPLWDWNDSKWRVELQRLRDTPKLRQKYWPAIVLMTAVTDFSDLADVQSLDVRTQLLRDAALTTIALELYHRQTGRWPDRLDELVPRFLPELPVDQFDGRPLRYRAANGKPLLYSVGPNRRDEGGARPRDGGSGSTGPDGDWRLFPPVGPMLSRVGVHAADDRLDQKPRREVLPGSFLAFARCLFEKPLEGLRPDAHVERRPLGLVDRRQESFEANWITEPGLGPRKDVTEKAGLLAERPQRINVVH